MYLAYVLLKKGSGNIYGILVYVFFKPNNFREEPLGSGGGFKIQSPCFRDFELSPLSLLGEEA